MNPLKEQIKLIKKNIYKFESLGVIVENIQRFYLPMEDEIKIEAEKIGVPKSVIDFYSIYDGVRFKWFSNPEEGVGGEIRFVDMKGILGNWEEVIYFEDDLKDNELLQYFRPFDLPSSETSCGLLITPNYVSESIYYHIVGDNELYDLDLDFEGYVEMMAESRGFSCWQIVLLDLQKGKESSATMDFKKYMPNIFKNSEKPHFNFNWNDFVKKYESLMLSKRR